MRNPCIHENTIRKNFIELIIKTQLQLSIPEFPVQTSVLYGFGNMM